MILKQYLYILLILLIGSCTIPVEDLPETKDKIIIQCEFSSGQDMELFVFKGVGMPTEGELPEIPDSAYIEVRKDGHLLDVSRRTAFIPFYKLRMDALPGQEFDLELELPEFSEVQSVSATSYIPYPVKIHSSSIEYVKDSINNGGELSMLYSLDLFLSDNNEEKYYELGINGFFIGEEVQTGDTMWTKIDDFTAGDLSFEANEGREGLRYLNTRSSLIIDYYGMKGETNNLLFSLSKEYESQLIKMDLTIKTHTKAAFDFLKSYDQTQNNYSSEFPILHSNISNGIGLFTGYSRSNFSITSTL